MNIITPSALLADPILCDSSLLPPQGSTAFRNAFAKAQSFLSEQQQDAKISFLADGLPDDSFEYPKDVIKVIQDACKLHDLEVVLENPRGWMNGAGGSRHTRSLIMNIQMCLMQIGVPFVQRIVTSKNTFDKRETKPNQLCFSYHSADTELNDNPRVIRIKESYLPPYYTFNTTGFSGWGNLANDKSMFEESQRMPGPEAFEFVHNLRNETSRGLSKYAQPESVGAPIEGNYVFHPMQISDDTVMKLARIQAYDLLDHLIQTANETKINLVIKRHPRCKDDSTRDLLERAVSLRSPYVHLSNASINDLISHSQSVVVVNSGTGMEALIRGKPVYCVGHSDYHYIAHQVEQENQLKAAFEKPISRMDPLTEATFIQYYFQQYCVSACNPRAIQQRVVGAIARWIELQEN